MHVCSLCKRKGQEENIGFKGNHQNINIRDVHDPERIKVLNSNFVNWKNTVKSFKLLRDSPFLTFRLVNFLMNFLCRVYFKSDGLSLDSI